mmetsp:Transcript_36732/g.83096  ORF Transcript_36732/g.83096 Transcript_36732/m.83096 type:complete len:107 (-) Transcript_36732:154-474(-)
MVFSVLFRTRLLPQAVQPSTISSAVQWKTISMASSVAKRGFVSTTSTLAAAKACSSQGSLAVRSYGTRSVWNVGTGRFYFLFWVIPCTGFAGFVQEVLGPYVFFHE